MLFHYPGKTYTQAMEDKKIICDTNILVYLSNNISVKTEIVNAKIHSLKNGGNILVITEQILREFLVVKTNLLKLSSSYKGVEILRKDIEIIKHNFKIIYPSVSSTEFLLSYVQKYSLQGNKIHDAAIVATAAGNSIKSIYTENKNDFLFAENEGFEIIDSNE